MIVRHLIDVPGAESTLAEWFIEEWEPYYGESGAGDARADLRAAAARDRLPICLVALGPDGRVLGTIALREQSVAARTHFTPWVAAFLVGREHRGQGVGTALLAAVEREARGLGLERLYVATDVAHRLLGRRGWHRLTESASTLRGDAEIYSLDL